ncbi:MAG: hypothetical protein ACREQ5_10720 [Candidatus Dormibacteria bacterium]
MSPVYGQRGYHMTGQGYWGADQVSPVSGRPPMRLEPDVDYVKVPPGPLFDRAWQGFQKENALAALQYASRHPGMGPHVPGTDPPGSVYERNTMQYLKAGLPTTQKMPADVGAVGPGLDWMPNPTSPSPSYVGEAPSVWQTIWRRFTGAGG